MYVYMYMYTDIDAAKDIDRDIDTSMDIDRDIDVLQSNILQYHVCWNDWSKPAGFLQCSSSTFGSLTVHNSMPQVWLPPGSRVEGEDVGQDAKLRHPS